MKMKGLPTFKGSWPWPWVLDLGSGHTAYHRAHSSTSTYTPNFIEIEETFCGRTDVRTYGRTDGPTLIGRLKRVDLKMSTTGGQQHPRVSTVHCLRTSAEHACHKSQSPIWGVTEWLAYADHHRLLRRLSATRWDALSPTPTPASEKPTSCHARQTEVFLRINATEI